MLILVCSVKGSPGVTTLATALGARWPSSERPVVIEADPGGGDLIARWRLAESPGLMSLAVAARRIDDPGLVDQHAQSLPGGLRVVASPVGGDQARGALGVLAGSRSSLLRTAADQPGRTVICDVGRLDSGSAALPLLKVADATLVVARPRDDELAHVAQHLTAIARWTRHPELVLVGEGYSTREVTNVLGIDVLARIPHDPAGAAVLGGQPGQRTPSRSRLGRAADRLATRVHAQVITRAGANRLAPQPMPTEADRTVNGATA
jgi:hypothetical protein